MQRGGRPKNSFWQELSFISKKENGKNVAFCPRCKRTLSNTCEERLRNHRKKCSLAEKPMDISQNSVSGCMEISLDIDREVNIANDIIINNNIVDYSSELDVSIIKVNGNDSLGVNYSKTDTTRPVIRRQKSINSFADKISEKEINSFNEALLLFIIENNIDFDIVGSNTFKDFIKKLRPAYLLPTPQKLSSTLLDSVYKNQLDMEKKKGIKTFGFLFIIKEDSCILVFVRKLCGITFFLNNFTLFFEDQEEKEIELKIVVEAIELANTKHDINVIAIVSKEFLLKNLNLNVWFIPCNVEILNLVAESVTNEEVYNEVRIVLINFKKYEKILMDSINDTEENFLITGRETWKTHLLAYSTFLKRIKMIRRKIAEGHITCNRDITSLVFDDDLIEKVENLQQILEQMTNFIKKFGDDNFSIADAIETWLDFILNADNHNLRQSLFLNFQKIKSPVFLTANFLHPAYRGRRLDNTELAIVNEFLLDNLDAAGLDQLTAFKNNKGIFSKLIAKHIKSPTSFWTVAEQEAPKLSEFVFQILHIPPSAINMKFTFDEQKNLSKDQIDKIRYLYYSFRLRESN